jgi:hypothetical protein
VHLDLRGLVGDVVAGDVGVDRDVDAHRLRRLLRRVPRHRRDGLVEHPHVELEPDGRHVPGLLAAEQVAGAADLEVAHRDLEARAELGVVGEGREPLAGLLGERGRRGVEEVRVGALA